MNPKLFTLLPSLNSRFLAITKNKCYYWYYDKDYKENKMPLGVFELKNLHSADIVPDYTIGGQTNVFCVQVSSWMKKDLVKGPRTYYFSVDSKAELYCWAIYLNFLKMKAIYDNFTTQFGQINLPFSYEQEGVLNMKNKFKQSNILKNINSFSVSAYLKNTYNRKFVNGVNTSKVEKKDEHILSPNRNSSLKRVSVMHNLLENTVIFLS